MKSHYLRKLMLSGRLLTVVLFASFIVTGFAQFGNGNGTAEDPWVIETAEHLNNIRNYLGGAHADKHYIQRADIDLGVPPWNEGEGWEPMGTGHSAGGNANAFMGKYDGNGYLIRNLTINRPETRSVSLFGTIENAHIQKLGLVDVNIVGSREVGAIGGYSSGQNTLIEQCFVTGRIEAETNVGGIVGRHGCNQGGTQTRILDCYSTARIVATVETDRSWAGGISGRQYRGLTRRCYAVGLVEVNVPGDYNGAVIGRVGGTIDQIYWNTDTCGQESGIGGRASPGNSTEELLQQDTYDGFDFDNVWSIEEGEAYPFLQWEGLEPGDHNYPPPSPPSNLRAVGNDTVINLFWDAPIHPQLGEPDGYNVYRDENMINEELVEVTQYQDTGLINWEPHYYVVTAVYDEIETEPTSPVLMIANDYPDGDGSAEDPYLVESATQLNGIRYLLRSHFRQNADIRLDEAPWNEGEGWEPIGDNVYQFFGSYDGNEYVIAGLTIDRDDDYQGLFGFASNTTIENVTLTDVDIDGGGRVGALVGETSHTDIINCYASGTVRGSGRMIGGLVARVRGSIRDSRAYVDVEGAPDQQDVGGLYGYSSFSNAHRSYAAGDVTGGDYVGGFGGNDHSTDKYECFATGDVTGNDGVGGFLGLSAFGNAYRNCYAMGDVTGNSNVGGFIGEGRNDLHNCYAIGRVTGDDNVGGLIGNQTRDGNIVSSYWDTETTGQEVSDGGEPRDSRHMTHPYEPGTYDGWDFDNVWVEDPAYQNRGYPYLHHQEIEPIIIPDPPVVNVEIVEIDNEKHVRLSWQLVEDALSYLVYATTDPDTDDWGEPLQVLGEDAVEFTELLDEDYHGKFFKVTASSEEAP